MIEDGNIAIFLSPHPDDSDGVCEELGTPSDFLGAIAMSEVLKGDIGDIAVDLIPDKWEGKFTIRLYDIEQFSRDLEKRPDRFVINPSAAPNYKEEGVTHLALIEGPNIVGSKPFYFGVYPVTHTALLVPYCAEKGKYRFFHCISCGKTYLYWLLEMQEEWKNAASKGVSAHANTLN